MRFDLLAVLFESDSEAIAHEVLVGDRSELALEVTFGDDHPVANLEMRHTPSLAQTSATTVPPRCARLPSFAYEKLHRVWLNGVPLPNPNTVEGATR